MNLILVALVSLSAFSKSKDWRGFVEVRNGVRLFVQHHPAQNGMPTLFVANGLTHDTRDYQGLARELSRLDPDIGIVRFDLRGMGQTLLDSAPLRERIYDYDQVEDIRLLKKALQIEKPVSLMGLSYGGALTLQYSIRHPDDFDHFIAFAPMLERLPEQDQWIRQMVTWYRLMARMMPYTFEWYLNSLQNLMLESMVNWHRIYFPGDGLVRSQILDRYTHFLTNYGWLRKALLSEPLPDPDHYEDVYDYFLRILIYSTYWMAEPGVLENKYKLEGVFRMVQGIKEWNSFGEAFKLPEGKIYVVGGVQDEHVKIDRLDMFWHTVPQSSRSCYLRLLSTHHKIPQERPNLSARWITKILLDHPDLKRGWTFDGDPVTGMARHGNTEIPF